MSKLTKLKRYMFTPGGMEQFDHGDWCVHGDIGGALVISDADFETLQRIYINAKAGVDGSSYLDDLHRIIGRIGSNVK